jgi:hypothetical protein
MRINLKLNNSILSLPTNDGGETVFLEVSRDEGKQLSCAVSRDGDGKCTIKNERLFLAPNKSNTHIQLQEIVHYWNLASEDEVGQKASLTEPELAQYQNTKTTFVADEGDVPKDKKWVIKPINPSA